MRKRKTTLDIKSSSTPVAAGTQVKKRKVTTKTTVKPNSYNGIKYETKENGVETPSGLSFFSKIGKRNLLLFVTIVILLALLYYFREQFIVATVNGQPIWRTTLIQELEKQSGQKALDNLITKILILQEAKKQNVSISDEETNSEVKKLEESFSKQGQNLNQLLELQGVSRNEFIEQVRIRKIAEKLAGKDISVTDQEINDYLDKNKNFLPQNLSEDEAKANIKQQLEQQKANDKIQSWIKSLRDNAKINFLKPY